jgi:Fic family protein
MRLLDLLKTEKESKYNSGLYHETQILLTYNSNHIEGNSLTEEQTRFMYDTDSFLPLDGRIDSVNDIVEANNHFRLFNHMLYTADEPLSEAMIKEYHRILRVGTSDEAMGYKIGEYKSRANVVGNIITTDPYEVHEAMENLLIPYNMSEKKTLKDIIMFHVQYETIHPFQEGNGRTGRMIVFKECLANDIVPMIVRDINKQLYYIGLREYWRDNSKLYDYFVTEQKVYEGMIGRYTVDEAEYSPAEYRPALRANEEQGEIPLTDKDEIER